MVCFRFIHVSIFDQLTISVLGHNFLKLQDSNVLTYCAHNGHIVHYPNTFLYWMQF